MKAVLISIRPKWCQKIISGEKTIEVRKTRPRLNPPFKCYIHQTGQGGVIGEFVCDDIFERIVQVGTSCETPKYCLCDWNMDCTPLDRILSDACLTLDELEKYLDGGAGYGWHISNLKIYDTPKDLNEFWFPPKLYCEKERCGGCPFDQVPDVNGEYSFDCEWKRPLTRPPQSWCYVAEEA